MSESMLTAVTPTAPRFGAEGPDLGPALDAALRLLDAAGITPEAYAALPPAERDTDFWRDARLVWSARAPTTAPQRCVLRLARGGAVAVRAFPSPESAIEAAIAAIEVNEAYPQSIEQNGAILLDRAEILREWEERHVPG